MYSVAISILLISNRPVLEAAVSRDLASTPSTLTWTAGLDLALARDDLRTFDVVLLETEEVSEVGELRAVAPWLPIVVIAQQPDHSRGLAAIREGASEYVSAEEVGSGFLFRVVRYCVERARVEAALEASREQLFRSQKMEAIGRTAAGIAHDFRQFVQVIIGNCSLMKRLEPAPIMSEMIDEIRSAGWKANGLVEQLLKFARGDSPARSGVNLNRLLLEDELLLRTLLRPGMVLMMELTSEPLPVLADSGLEQVLMNLTVNAVDALRDQGTILFETRLLRLDRPYAGRDLRLEPGNYALIEVSDSGCGIEPAVLDRIFEPFFTTKPRGEGTGIGLSTAYSQVQGWGGQLAAASLPGLGTTFKIVLPCLEVVPLEPEDCVLPDMVRLVDEDLPTRLMLRKDLAAIGCDVIELEDASLRVTIRDFKAEDSSAGLVLCDLSPRLLDHLGLLNPTQTPLRTPFSRHELSHALARLVQLPACS